MNYKNFDLFNLCSLIFSNIPDNPPFENFNIPKLHFVNIYVILK